MLTSILVVNKEFWSFRYEDSIDSPTVQKKKKKGPAMRRFNSPFNR